MSAIASSAALASTCASCFIGAGTTILHTFPYAIETITVSVVPHVTVIPGISTTTAYRSNTQTTSGQSLSQLATTYTDTDDLVWTVGDATLTYPTTYVEFASLQGAAASTGAANATQDCAQQTQVSALNLPSSTDEASFIYPLTAAQQYGGQLPQQLLQYLQTLPAVSSQFFGAALTACSSLPATATAAAANAVAPTSGSAQQAASSPQAAAVPVSTPTNSPQLVKVALAQVKLPIGKHKTAAVISVITGKPIVTTMKPKPTKKPSPAGKKPAAAKHPKKKHR